MTERKPVVWKRFKWLQYEKDGETIIQPYDEFPSHVTCSLCGKNTDYNLWNQGGCIYCSISMNLDKWQEIQDKIDAWFMIPGNEVYGMEECPLISDYELIEDDDIHLTFKFTWVETGETATVKIGYIGQGIPRYKVIAVCNEGVM